MLKNNLNKIILCATAKSLVAGVWHASLLQHSQVFLHDETGLENFANWLANYPEIPIYLIANAVEEDYRLESLPHSTGREKTELIERKLNQYYRGLIFRTAHFIQREKDKRKDDKFLFVALNNDEFLQSWVNIIQQADAPLVGVYLLPMLSQLLCKQSNATQKLSEPHILLCEKLSSGLRQTYLHNGRLRMSRLIPNVPEDPNQLGYFYLVETQKTRLYLMSKRFISRDVTLSLKLTSLNDDMQAIKQSFSQEPGIDCETLHLRAITKQINIHANSIEKIPELLHMQLLANGHPIDNLAPSTLTKSFQLNIVREWIKKMVMAVSIAGLAMCAYFLLNGLEQQSQFESAKQATQMIEQRHQAILNQSPKTQLTAQALKAAVTLHQKIQQLPKSPHRLMRVMSNVMEKNPEIHLERLRWVQTNDFNVSDETDPNNAITHGSPNGSTMPNPPTNNIVQKVNTTQLFEIGFVNAQIMHFNGNYREAMQQVQQFAEALKLAPEVSQVEILQMPINMSSYTDLRGSTANAQQNEFSSAHFKIKIQLNPI